MAERARSAKNKAKAKAKKAPKSPGKGHNSGAFHAVPDETYDRNIKKILNTKKALDKIKIEYDQKRGEHRAAYSTAKQDGCDIDAIRLALKLEESDAGVVVTTYSNVGRILKLIESPLAEQMDLFQNMVIPLPANATLAGTQAFKEGHERGSNPFKAGTQEYANFDEAWMEAQKATAMEMGDSAVN